MIMGPNILRRLSGKSAVGASAARRLRAARETLLVQSKVLRLGVDARTLAGLARDRRVPARDQRVRIHARHDLASARNRHPILSPVGLPHRDPSFRLL